MSSLPARRTPDTAPGAPVPAAAGLNTVRYRVLLVPASREPGWARAWLRLQPAVCLPVPPACRSVWSAVSALSAAGAGNVLATLPARLLLLLTWAGAALTVTLSAAVALAVLVTRTVRQARR